MTSCEPAVGDVWLAYVEFSDRGGLGRSLHVHGSYIESKSGYQFGRLIATSNAEFSNGVARLIAISQVIGGFTCI